MRSDVYAAISTRPGCIHKKSYTIHVNKLHKVCNKSTIIALNVTVDSLQKSPNFQISNRIGMKFEKIVLSHDVIVILSKWQPWRPLTARCCKCTSVCRLLASPPSARMSFSRCMSYSSWSPVHWYLLYNCFVKTTPVTVAVTYVVYIATSSSRRSMAHYTAIPWKYTQVPYDKWNKSVLHLWLKVEVQRNS